MADLTSSQDIARNMYSPLNGGIFFLEKFILKILRKFRFCEIAKVVDVEPTTMKVRCELLYRKLESAGSGEGTQGRITRWLPVHSSFASIHAGIIAPPRIGDFGVVFFRLADTSGGFFYGMHWGKKTPLPETHQPIQKEDLVLTRNDSWYRIDPSSDMELFHKDGNQAFIASGYNRLIAAKFTPDKFYTQTEGAILEQQEMSLQHINRPLGKEFRVASFTKTTSKQEGMDGCVKTLHVSRVRVPSKPDGEVPEIGQELDHIAFLTLRAPYPLEIEEVQVKKSLTKARDIETFTMERCMVRRRISAGAYIYPVEGEILEEVNEVYSNTYYTYLDITGKPSAGMTVHRERGNESGVMVEDKCIWNDWCVIKTFGLTSGGGIVDEVTPGRAQQEFDEEIEFMRFEKEEFDNLNITDDTVEKQKAEEQRLSWGVDQEGYAADGRFHDYGGPYLEYTPVDNERLKSERGN